MGPLALGCEPLGGTDWGTVDSGKMRRAVRCALDRGISVFDTADVYGLGRSESELSLALGEDRHRVTIITKGGVRWDEPSGDVRSPTRADASAIYLTTAIRASLRRLRLEAIPLYLVHRPDSATSLEETIECLERARERGEIVSYGFSNHESAKIDWLRAHCAMSAIEVPYSLLSTDEEHADLVRFRRMGLATLTYGVLAQGLLTGKYTQHSVFDSSDRRRRLGHFRADLWHERQPLLDAVAHVSAETGRSAAQVAIRWVIDTSAATTVIVGAKSCAQLHDVAGALDWTLTAGQFERLAHWRRFPGPNSTLATGAIGC